MKLLPFLFILLITNYCTAQTWQWAIGGGSSNNSWVDNHSEFIGDLAVDMNGNVYTISTVDTGNLNVAGTPKKAHHLGRSLMINSFTCNGNLRWSKIFCSAAWEQPFAIEADSADGIYIIASLGNMLDTTHIDDDTALVLQDKAAYLIKYDTAGNLKWFAQPEPAGLSVGTFATQIDLNVDGQGNTFWLCHLYPGLYAGSYNVTTQGYHILKYTSNGIFQGAFALDMHASPQYARMLRDISNNRYLVAGRQYGKIYVGNDSITHSMFIAAFDNAGNYLWKQESSISDPQCGFMGRPVLDAEGSIYLSGFSKNGDKFGSYSINHGSGNVTPFIAKLDKSGKVLWAHDAIVKKKCQSWGLALRNSGEVDMIAYSDDIKWPGFKDSMVSEYPQPIVTRFNTQTGKILCIDSLPVYTDLTFGGIAAFPSSIVADGSNNIIIGGAFNDTIKTGNILVKGTGGYNDFFVAKYGYDSCNCADIPQPKFTSVNTSANTFNFTYTGSTPYTSILWDFGDGNTSTQTNPTHSFAKDGNYAVTVTVTNDCGDNIYGSNQVALKVGTIRAAEILIYPNPAKDMVQIEGATPVSVQLQNIQGQLLKNSTGDLTRLDIADVPPGIYLLMVETKEGVAVHKLVKE